MARHGAVNVDRASERLCDLMQGHVKATRDRWRRSFLRGTIDDQPCSDYLNELFRNMLMSKVSNRQSGRGGRLPITGAFILGFASSAFFDGILLHQVLQWHHLLSLVQGGSFRDMRVQILADGLFHVASYFLAVAGVLLLWQSRRTILPDRVIFAWAILGFAAWQFVDVILVHWAIGLHRVRVDVSNPLPWDIGWLAVFGLLPLFAGFFLRKPPPSGADHTGRSRAMLSVAVATAAALSALPLGGAATAVIFKDSMSASDTFFSGRRRWWPGDLERTPWRNHDHRFAATE
jgi:uncharacterized membrane protein